MRALASVQGFVIDSIQTALRLFPWPTKTGLRSIGDPDSSSPVLLTCNYDLTVRRLVRRLRGHNVWLLVAPSGGINVWCAAAGGHLTTHQVVTVLKTSGIAEKVSHRRVVLPQLAATGVLALDVFRRSRWKVHFGPVSMDDLPEYLAKNEKTDRMRRVRFPLRDRLEMAAMWAAPTIAILGGLALWLEPGWSLPLSLLAASMSIAVFTTYDRFGAASRWILWGGFTLLSIALTAAMGGTAIAMTAAVVAPAFLTALLTFDYTGSTPLEGGSHFEERKWNIALDEQRCKGVFRCWEVCPEACFEKLEDQRKVVLGHDERCIRCGACVVQCPKDALFFEDAEGERIEPAVIRKFKLNLLGKRINTSMIALVMWLPLACNWGYGPKVESPTFGSAALHEDGARCVFALHDKVYRHAEGIRAFPDGGIPQYDIDRHKVGIVDVHTGKVNILIDRANRDWLDGHGSFHISEVKGRFALVGQGGQRSDYQHDHLWWQLDLVSEELVALKIDAEFVKVGRDIAFVTIADADFTLIAVTEEVNGTKEVWSRTAAGTLRKLAATNHYYGSAQGEIWWYDVDARAGSRTNYLTGSTVRERRADFAIPRTDPTGSCRPTSGGKELLYQQSNGGVWRDTPLAVRATELR